MATESFIIFQLVSPIGKGDRELGKGNMELLHVVNAGRYTRPEKGHQVVPRKWLSLGVSGLLHQRGYYPDGTPSTQYDSDGLQAEHPMLSLGWPGFVTDFEYGEGRENWVVMFESDALSYDADSHGLSLVHGGQSIAIPQQVFLDTREVPEFRQTFSTICDLFLSAIPSNLLSADLLLSSVLLRFLRMPQVIDDPVERLRKAIDEDVHWQRSIEAICTDIGYSCDYLRRVFQKRYGVTPGAYRMQKRLRRIQYLLAYGGMSLKEIAYEVGMGNVTHLNALIRAQLNCTPSELARQFRR